MVMDDVIGSEAFVVMVIDDAIGSGAFVVMVMGDVTGSTVELCGAHSKALRQKGYFYTT
jgi:hypothetical protein